MEWNKGRSQKKGENNVIPLIYVNLYQLLKYPGNEYKKNY